MGEVYKARDTRLNRIIAIKVSSEQFSERFEREARAIAALNHPNICTLHDVGPNYLVMEFIESTRSRGLCPSIRRSSMRLRFAVHSTLRTRRESLIETLNPRISWSLRLASNCWISAEAGGDFVPSPPRQ
jgi:serine/threonine protein kinase